MDTPTPKVERIGHSIFHMVVFGCFLRLGDFLANNVLWLLVLRGFLSLLFIDPKEFFRTGASGSTLLDMFEVSAIDANANKGVDLQSRRGDHVKSKWLVTCAGLQADYVAQMAGGAKGPTVLPFRGTYHELKPEFCNIITRNIYPVPDPRSLILGIWHLGGILFDREAFAFQ
eukprot:Gb_31055 [translate_table: standard]